MKHLLDYANRHENFDPGSLASKEQEFDCIRIVNSLIDLGTRSRNIGKTTALFEKAYELLREYNNVYIIVKDTNTKNLLYNKYSKVSDKMEILTTNQFSDKSFDISKIKAFLADEIEYKYLVKHWNSRGVNYRAGWMAESEKRY